MHIRKLLVAFGAVLFMTASGCGPKVVKVSGRILKDGQAVTISDSDEQGMSMPMTVVFRTESGGQSYPAKVDRSAGTYEVTLPAGKYRASVFVPPKGGFPDPKDKKKGGPPIPKKDEGEIHDLSESKTLDLTVK
jgi:hypothetical protein